jgi:hypothetical protein
MSGLVHLIAAALGPLGIFERADVIGNKRKAINR